MKKQYDSWDEIDKENNDFLKLVKNWIKKHYGKRCTELAAGCPACQLWSIFDILQTHLLNRK